jgi:hypothetical protein
MRSARAPVSLPPCVARTRGAHMGWTHGRTQNRRTDTSIGHITRVDTWPLDGRWPICGANPLGFPARSIWRKRTHSFHARRRGDLIREPAAPTLCFRAGPSGDRIGWQAGRISRQAVERSSSYVPRPHKRHNHAVASLTAVLAAMPREWYAVRLGTSTIGPCALAAMICAALVRRAAVSIQHRSAAPRIKVGRCPAGWRSLGTDNCDFRQ